MVTKEVIPSRIRLSSLEVEKLRARIKSDRMTRSTRRLLRSSFKLRQALKRLERRLKLVKTREENRRIKQSVRTLRAAKRVPHLRLRSMFELGFRSRNPYYVFTKNASGVVTRTDLIQNAKRKVGIDKAMSDYHPIARLDPPRNLTSIKSVRVNALSASIVLKHPLIQYYYQDVSLLDDKVALLGLGGVPAAIYDLSQPVGFDTSLANRALLKAQSKVYAADIQGNEYLVEWRQVINLLKDPLRTVLKFHRVLERWMRHDAWIYIPKTRFRYFDGGTLVSKTPVGGQLISMRTRRELPLKEAPSALIKEASNRWLQYRYGIAPAVSDITSVMGMWVNGSFHKEAALKAGKGRYTVEKQSKDSEYTISDAIFTHTFKVRESWGEFYVAKQWYDLNRDPPALYKLGLHPSQFLQVFWNAIPWSFVADWVVNLDDWMVAQRDVPWIKLHGNHVTHKIYHKYVATLVSSRSISYGTYATISGSPIATCFREEMRREIDLPRATELPVSQAWSKLKNELTALALIIQTSKTKRK